MENPIITIEERAIEAFAQGLPASRYHLVNIKSAMIHSDKKEHPSLQIFTHGSDGFATAPLSTEAARQALRKYRKSGWT